MAGGGGSWLSRNRGIWYLDNPFSGGTISLAGGGITVLAGSGDATISSILTLNGGNTFNMGSGRLLTLGAYTRSPGSTLNVQGAGTVKVTSGSLVNRFIGP